MDGCLDCVDNCRGEIGLEFLQRKERKPLSTLPAESKLRLMGVNNMKMITHSGKRDPHLHIRTPLGIINIRVGLIGARGQRVESIQIIPNNYAGEPRVVLNGYPNTRLVEEVTP